MPEADTEAAADPGLERIAKALESLDVNFAAIRVAIESCVCTGKKGKRPKQKYVAVSNG